MLIAYFLLFQKKAKEKFPVFFGVSPPLLPIPLFQSLFIQWNSEVFIFPTFLSSLNGSIFFLEDFPMLCHPRWHCGPGDLEAYWP
jgi:hypothetical protein